MRKVICMYQGQPNTAYSRSAGTSTAQKAGRDRQSIPWDAESSRQEAREPSRASAGGAALQMSTPSSAPPFPVLDVNDESPTFFPAVYNVSLPEDVARDFKVVRVNCTDADIGLNAELSYFITGVSPSQDGNFGCRKARAAPRARAGAFCISALPFQTLSSIALC